jgi:hypothetical protein
MAPFANKREKTREEAASIAIDMLLTTESVPLLTSALKGSRDNWPLIVRNPHTPAELLCLIEGVGDNPEIIAAARAHANYRPPKMKQT